MKKRKVRNVIMAIIDILIVLLVVWFIIGYINFNKLSKDKEPLFVVRENSYKTLDGKVDVYDNIIYKVVRHEVTGKNISYSLRLWFMDDIK